MATNYWRPRAGFRAQVDSLTIDTAPTAGDIGNVTIGYSTLTVIAQSGTTTTSLYAAAIANAINARGLSDNLVANERRKAGGQSLPEFRDVEAIVDPTNTARVLIRSKVPGVPFYAAGASLITETASGSTLAMTAASVETATGQWHWNNASNWSAGTVPATGEVVVFQDASVGPKYGLPAGSLRIEIQQHMSFTGEIGLPPMNPLGYSEYRPRHVELDEHGASTTITINHTFGLGKGEGSPLINIVQAAGYADLVVNGIVYATGAPKYPGVHALNLVIDNTPSGAGTVSVFGGSVNLGQQFGTIPVYPNLNVGRSADSSADVLISNISNNFQINQAGGRLLYEHDTSVAPSSSLTVTVSGGHCTIRNVATSAGNVTLVVRDGTIQYDAVKTVLSLVVGSGGVFDMEHDQRSTTVSSIDLYEGASLLDKHGRLPNATTIDLNQCSIDDVKIRFGNNRRITVGAVA